MADPRIEALTGVEVRFAEAGAAFDQACKAVYEAAEAEAAVAHEREDAYRATLNGGFIIERILEPELVTYTAGHKLRPVGGIFGGSEEDRVDLAIDEKHAVSLIGKFASLGWVASHTGARYPEYPHQDQEPARQGGIGVQFKVAQRLSNTSLPKGVYEDGWPRREGITEYCAALKAIAWRLPTDEEIEEFGTQKLETAAK